MTARTALVTGANRGIGAALLVALGQSGWQALGTARAPGVDDLLPLDVTVPDTFADLKNRLAGRPIDLLVCNAGVYADKGQSLDKGFPADLWAATFATNVTGVFQTVQCLLPALRAAGGAKVAIIASQMGSNRRAGGGSYIYRASKAAAVNLGRNLAVDLGRDGISVGIYHPGWVRTDMGGAGADIGEDEAAAGLVARFAALGPATTGCFETWDGRTLDF